MIEVIEVAVLILSGLIGALLGSIPQAVLAGVNIDHPLFLTISCLLGYVASIVSLVLALYVFGIWKGLVLWLVLGFIITYFMKGHIVKWNGIASLFQVPFTIIVFLYIAFKYF